jgi:hypothetical protein
MPAPTGRTEFDTINGAGGPWAMTKRIAGLWLLTALALAGGEFGPGPPQLPPQAPPDETFQPAIDCAGVEPDPRFAKRCQVFLRR